MEFHEKLQELRKHKGLTQEELAAQLYVSRTAVSKWESGRGYPNIDSLKAIAAFYGVTIDALLTGGEALTIAEEETRRKQSQLRDWVFDLLDLSMGLLFFLPVFGREEGGAVSSVPLIALTGAAPYLKAAYCMALACMALMGLAGVLLRECRHPLWMRHKTRASLALHAVCVLLFIVSPQRYVAAILFAFLLMKALIYKKTQ